MSARVLESIQAADLPSIARLFSEVEVREFLGGPLGLQLSARRAVELAEQSSHAWAVRECAGSPSMLGVVILDRHHELEDLEISFLFLPEHWGKGHASAAVRQAMAHAFGTLGLPRVVAETQSANTASVRLLERIGFHLLRKVVRFGAEQSIYIAESAQVKAAT